ncbi:MULTISPECIES: Tn3 family transposase [unclassified Pseudoalteromonas]|uniref:Tn3 family transposase n=1 Tax=unclassified Pseudoalteromonas TaxID=194690 RepID=UPI0023A986DF|nr:MULTISPECIES: Tn3 family transposase [unclassified Pseudoalteromonas]
MSESEINELYALPNFSRQERDDCFSLDDETQKLVNELRRTETRAYFILLLGYFRSRPIVFNFSFDKVSNDLEYVRAKYFSDKSMSLDDLSPTTKTKLINKLLKYTGFTTYQSKVDKQPLLKRLNEVVKINLEPRYVFDECIAYFGQRRIALAGYTTLQDTISTVLSNERSRIESVLNQHLSSNTKVMLLKLLDSKSTFTDLAKLKRMAKDFSTSQITRELTTHKIIRSLYPEIKALIAELELSPKNLEYYASLVKHKSVYKLRRHTDSQTLLYLVCYLFFRYRETNDNLVSAFVYLVHKLTEAAKNHAKQRIVEDVNIVRTKLKSAGSLLKYFIDSDIDDDLIFGDVRKKAFKLLPAENIKLLSEHLDNTDFDDRQYNWQFIDKQSYKISKLIRSLFMAIDIEFIHLKDELHEQYVITYSELGVSKTIQTINLDVVPKSDRKYLEGEVTKKTANRFEYFLYRKAELLFQSNHLTVKESVNNRSLTSDLIQPKEWQHKADIIESTGLDKLSVPINDILAEKQYQLEKKLKEVSNHIFNGDNKYVEVIPGKAELKWSIPNSRWQQAVENPLYNQIQHMGIVELMLFVDEKTNYLNSFTHIATTKEKLPVDKEDLVACILANGTNYGLYKMASISDRSMGKLRNVDDSYIRYDTLEQSNDQISNAIAKLPIFAYYHVDDHQLFSSIDGQKFECRINTFKARYSSKYFSKGKGVSALTLVSNHVPVNTQVIGANEYEGHFAFDLLYNNTSEIQPNILSTDNHGTNNVNFAILDFFGYTFAPRYAKMKRVFFDLFDVTEENGGRIQLNKDINHKLISEEWDSIQHIVCSLNRKTTTQSTIIRKLSNGKSRTLSALHEYDRLIKAIYVLEYVDNSTLRHYVQQALNRGEAYHQLKRAITSVNGNKFRGGNDYQVSQWNDCARLISNCIIYYNSALLSAFLQIQERNGRQDVVDIISKLSPVAWQHINLNGEYAFNKDRKEIDLPSLLSNIEPLENS